MLIRNFTPFSPLGFTSTDARGGLFGVFVLRGTFRIEPFAPLVPVPEQQPVVTADTYFGEPVRSSLRFESDLAPFKPRADIHVHGVAHAPGGLAAPRWQARVRVGLLEKRLTICGPRRWVRRGAAYQLTEPEACESVPIRYENAFGGVSRDAWGKPDVLEENPAGKGHVGEGQSSREPVVPAPQIESPEDPVTELGRRHAPQGFGPICRAWLPRRALAGTYDEAWLRDRFPALALDFDFAFYQSAHPDLVYPAYLSSGERIELDGMDPRGPLRFSIPRYALAIVARTAIEGPRVLPLFLDTLVLDVEERAAYLTWRARLAPAHAVREIDVRMQVEE